MDLREELAAAPSYDQSIISVESTSFQELGRLNGYFTQFTAELNIPGYAILQYIAWTKNIFIEA